VHLLRLRARRWRYARSVVLGFGVTLCATLGTAPLTAYHFNRISLITFIANPIVVPLLGFLPVSGGLSAAVLIRIMPRVSRILLRGVGMIIAVADDIVIALAAVPGGAVRTIGISTFELVLIYSLMAVPFIGARRLRRVTAIVSGFLLLVDAGYWCRERLPTQR